MRSISDYSRDTCFTSSINWFTGSEYFPDNVYNQTCLVWEKGFHPAFFLETFTKCSCSWANTSLWHLDKKYSSFPTIFEKNIGPYFKSGMSSSSVSLSGKCGEVKIHQIVFIKDIITNNINKNLKITNIAYTRLRGIVNKLTAFKMNN